MKEKTMRTFCRTFSTLGLVLAFAATAAVARDDEETIAPETTTIQLMLLRQKSVQQDLKISPELAKKIVEFTNKESDEFAKTLKQKDNERKEKWEALEKANKKFLEDNLSAEQRKRLEQITLQVTGLHQLNRPEVAKALGLTEEQQKTFKEMHKAAHTAMEAIYNDPKHESKNEKLGKLREEIHKKIEATLTAQQKEKVKEMIGEIFKGEIVFEEFEDKK
jgi:hypothetical protein